MKPRSVWKLPARHVGREVHVHDSLESTNALALELAVDDTAEGLVVMAREQTAGRGQHGRSWLSPPDTSVLMSTIVGLPAELCRPVLLTAWAAVSVCEVIERATGLTPSIKWPNDVLIGGKKVCGILIELRRRVVAGIGLNVRQTARHFEDAGLADATSLLVASGRPFSPLTLARKLCRRLDRLLDRLLAGKRAGLERAWSIRLGLIDREVIVECHDGERQGRLVSIGFDVLQLDGCEPLRPEEVRHVRAID